MQSKGTTSTCAKIGNICLKYFIIFLKNPTSLFFFLIFMFVLNDDLKGSDCCLQAVFANDTCGTGLGLFSV